MLVSPRDYKYLTGSLRRLGALCAVSVAKETLNEGNTSEWM